MDSPGHEILGLHRGDPGAGGCLALPCRCLLAIPITALSDRTGKRVLIASLGQIPPGLLLLLLPEIANPFAKPLSSPLRSAITPAADAECLEVLAGLGDRKAVGPASGIINGIGAGGGGTIAGFLVAFMDKATGS